MTDAEAQGTVQHFVGESMSLAEPRLISTNRSPISSVAPAADPEGSQPQLQKAAPQDGMHDKADLLAAGRQPCREPGSSSGECNSTGGSMDDRSNAGNGSGSDGRTNGGATTTGGTKETFESERTVLRGPHGDQGMTGSSAQPCSGSGDANGSNGSDDKAPSPEDQQQQHPQGNEEPGTQHYARPERQVQSQAPSSDGAEPGEGLHIYAHCSSGQQGGGSRAKSGCGDRPKLPRPEGLVCCPRCSSEETKFCYYNNYNINQPRYFCKSCQRYWTAGGTLRNVPVGSGRRKNKASSKKSGDTSTSMQLGMQSASSVATVSMGHRPGALPDMLAPYHFQPAMLLDPLAAAAYAGKTDVATLAQYVPAAAIGAVNPMAGVNGGPLGVTVAGVPPIPVATAAGPQLTQQMAEHLRHMGPAGMIGMTGVSAQISSAGMVIPGGPPLGFAPVAASLSHAVPCSTTGNGSRSLGTGSSFFPPGGHMATTATTAEAGSSDQQAGASRGAAGSSHPQASEDGSTAGRRVRAKPDHDSRLGPGGQMGGTGAFAPPPRSLTLAAGRREDDGARGEASPSAAPLAQSPEQQQQQGFQPTGSGDCSSLGKVNGASTGNPMEWLSYAAVANHQQLQHAAAQAAQLQAAAQLQGWNGAQNPYINGLGWPYGLYNAGAQGWAAYARIAPGGAWIDPSALAAAANMQQQQQAAQPQQQQQAGAGGPGKGGMSPSVAQQPVHPLGVQQHDGGAGNGDALLAPTPIHPTSTVGAQAVAWPGAWANLGPASGLGWGGWGAMPPPGMAAANAAGMQGGQIPCLLNAQALTAMQLGGTGLEGLMGGAPQQGVGHPASAAMRNAPENGCG